LLCVAAHKPIMPSRITAEATAPGRQQVTTPRRIVEEGMLVTKAV
jgi:hypothetical protein